MLIALQQYAELLESDILSYAFSRIVFYGIMLSNDNHEKSKDKKVIFRLQKKRSFYFLLALCMLQTKDIAVFISYLKKKKNGSF